VAKRKLVISLPALLLRISDGRVDIRDLDGETLYFFGVPREGALDAMRCMPGIIYGNGRAWEKLRRSAIYDQLQSIFLQADSESRAGYRVSGERQSFSELNELLISNGVSPLPLENAPYDFNSADLEKLIAEAEIPLELFGF
jgi:hypothetical protein